MDLAERLRGEGVVWFEEPMRVDLVDEYTRLCERSPIPIAAGENAYSRYGFRDILERRAVDVLQPDVHRVGGITEFMRVAALAEARDVPVAPHTSWELHTQLLACVATGVAVEYYEWFPDDAWDVRPSIVDGEAVVSSEVGIGAHLSTETLRRYSR